MKSFFTIVQFSRLTLTLAIFCLANLAAFGQVRAKNEIKTKAFCSNNYLTNNYSGNDKVSYKETREVNLPATGFVNVDGRVNGGISVKGEDRPNVLVRACVQTVGTTDEEARLVAKNTRIETGSQIRAEGAADESNSSVSYEILVPRRTNLKLLARNGGFVIASVEGTVEFETTNGGVILSDVAGDVRGRTRNGGVIVNLSGNSWRGSGLDVATTNGGVVLSIPDNYRARVETGTVNGGIRSDIDALSAAGDQNSGNRRKRVSADLNGGGALIRVVTTNGGVKINSLTGENL